MAYHDSFSAIAYGVTRTKKIRFFPYANSVFLRHPVLLASGVANIDKIAPGRVGAAYCSAGIETSVNLHVFDEDPVQACREAIEITRLVWTGKPVNYEGKHWSLTNVSIPYPAREGIPIWLATRGKKFKLAGELADGVVTHGKAPKYLQKMDKHLAEGAEITHRNHRKIERTVVLPLLVTEPNETEKARESLRGMLGAFVGGELSLDWLDTLDIAVDEIKPIREHIRSKGFSKDIADLVSNDLLDRLIYAYAVVGTPEECVGEIEEMRKNGATIVVPLVNKNWFPSLSEARRFIKLLGSKIVEPLGG
jgi:alkanesulfonate monooxygenase SsuD/methylene tetrahydromethanopterin reductase-like flavin-dependent oxidoreductase (luciferase family)